MSDSMARMASTEDKRRLWRVPSAEQIWDHAECVAESTPLLLRGTFLATWFHTPDGTVVQVEDTYTHACTKHLAGKTAGAALTGGS